MRATSVLAQEKQGTHIFFTAELGWKQEFSNHLEHSSFPHHRNEFHIFVSFTVGCCMSTIHSFLARSLHNSDSHIELEKTVPKARNSQQPKPPMSFFRNAGSSLFQCLRGKWATRQTLPHYEEPGKLSSSPASNSQGQQPHEKRRPRRSTPFHKPFMNLLTLAD